jgi:hypothetical protein
VFRWLTRCLIFIPITFFNVAGTSIPLTIIEVLGGSHMKTGASPQVLT